MGHRHRQQPHIITFAPFDVDRYAERKLLSEQFVISHKSSESIKPLLAMANYLASITRADEEEVLSAHMGFGSRGKDTSTLQTRSADFEGRKKNTLLLDTSNIGLST